MFVNLDKNGVKIKNFRADSASYQKEVIDLVSEQCAYFFIRNNSSGKFKAACGLVKDWEKLEINNEVKEVSTVHYKPFGEDKTYRIVVTRSKKEDCQIDFESNTEYNYYGIMTNNEELSNLEVILFYNQRGDAENSNKYLVSDFNLHQLPFMDIGPNTVYMYFMAMCATIFEWFKGLLVKNKTEGIELKHRVKTVCHRYITVCAVYITHARKNILKIFSDLDYEFLRI